MSHRKGFVRLLFIAFVACANVAIGATEARAQPGMVDYIDFSGTYVGENDLYHYHGVTFIDNGVAGHPMSIVALPGTGQKAIRLPGTPNSTNPACHGEFDCAVMHITFDEPQSTFTLSVVPPALGLVAVLSSVTPLGQDAYQAHDYSSCGGGTPPLVGLTLTAPAFVITEAKLYYTQCYAPNIELPGPTSPFIVTGLTYTLPLNPVPQNTTPPTVTIAAPQPGQVITPPFFSPDFNDYVTDLEVMGTLGPHSAIYSLTAQLNAHASVEMVYGTSMSSLQYSGRLQLDQATGLRAGSNTATVTAEDFEHHVASASVTFTVKPPPILNAGDYVALAAYTVTQTIDGGPQRLTNNLPAISDNPKNGYVVNAPSDALVQGKETLVRVFAILTHAANSYGGALQHVPALATVRPAGCGGPSCALATSMPPMTGAAPHKFNPGGITVSAYSPTSQVPFGDSIDQDEFDLSSTWDFVLQPAWTAQDLTLDVTINDGQFGGQWGQPTQPAVPEHCNNTAERQCQNAHRLELHLSFRPTATIVVAPVIVTVDGTYVCNRGTKQGQSFSVNNLTPTQRQIDEFFRMLNILYPLNVVEGPTTNVVIDASGNDDDFLVGLVDSVYDSSQEDFALGIVPVDSRCRYSFGVNPMLPDGSVTTGKATVGGTGAWAMADIPADAAHELGHNIGFDHWACENGVTNDECGVFPIPHGGIGAYGTDIGSWTVLPPGDNRYNSTPHAHDFMSYGQNCSIHTGVKNCDLGEWVSWYTYGILLNNFTPGSYDTDDPPALLVSGTIAPNGHATLGPAYQASVNHPIADHVTQDDPSDIYTLEGFDSHGNVLFVHNFEPHRVDVHTAAYGHVFTFSEAVPVVSNLARISLLHGGQQAGVLVSQAPGKTPTVTIDAPAKGATWPVGRTQTISWTASSPAHLPLFALVQYSPDGGRTRVTLGRNLRGSKLTINPDELAGSGAGTIYVEVSDGLNMATAVAAPFTVAAKAPTVHIIEPVAQERIEATMPFTMLGTAFDRQERLADREFSWSVDGTVRTTGARIATLRDLTPGNHTVTLTVTDSRGLVGKDSVNVLILTATGGMPPGGTSYIALITGLAVLVLLLILVVVVLWRRRRSHSTG